MAQRKVTLTAMRPRKLCPGYFERDVQEIIGAKGPDSTQYFCAICGKQVRPVFKDGGWNPLNHSAYPATDKNQVA